MKIYNEDDFDSDTFWKIAMPWFKKGETVDDSEARAQKVLDESGVQPIAETDQEPDLNDLLLINGRYYSIGILGSNRTFVHPVPDYDPDPEDNYFFQGREEPYCPYCGQKIDDAFEWHDEEGTMMCPHCRATFSYERRIVYSYTTSPCQKAVIRRI